MQVTGIQRTKRGRYSIYVDGEFYYALHVDVFASSPLTRGYETTEAELDELRIISEGKITRERAMRLLSARSYTAKGLYDKLLPLSDEDSATAAVTRMQELGLIDDADYARRYAADCVNLKHYSPRRTIIALERKGVDRETARQTVAAQETDSEQMIARIILRKYMRNITDDDEKLRAKAVNALVRLGYDYRDIRAVIANLREDENYYEYE